ALDYLTMDEAVAHCTRGLGAWDWASSDQGSEPDVVLACAGDVPALETVAAAALLREHLPALRVRVVNVVDLMRLQPPSEHPRGPPAPADGRRAAPPPRPHARDGRGLTGRARLDLGSGRRRSVLLTPGEHVGHGSAPGASAGVVPSSALRRLDDRRMEDAPA